MLLCQVVTRLLYHSRKGNEKANTALTPSDAALVVAVAAAPAAPPAPPAVEAVEAARAVALVASVPLDAMVKVMGSPVAWQAVCTSTEGRPRTTKSPKMSQDQLPK